MLLVGGLYFLGMLMFDRKSLGPSQTHRRSPRIERRIKESLAVAYERLWQLLHPAGVGVLTTIDAGRKHLGWRIRRIDRAVGASGGGRIIRGKQRSQRLLVTLLLESVVRTNGPGARYGRARLDRRRTTS